MSTAPSSTDASERIPSLDFLRGIAIFGILFINLENFAYPDSWSPWKYGFFSSVDYDVRFWVYFLTQGKFYTIFALLFGVGFYIFLERLENKKLGIAAMDIYARRLLMLFVTGVAHAYLIWDGDVLYHYAICGFLLFPFRSIGSRYLVGVIVLLACFQLIKSYELAERKNGWKTRYENAINIPKEQRSEDHWKQISFWERITSAKAPDTAEVVAKKPTYLQGLIDTYQHAEVHKGNIFYQNLLFPSLMAMILGILFYRSGIFHDYRSWKHYWLITMTVLGTGLIVNYLRYYQWTYAYFEPLVDTWKGWLFTFPKELLGIGYLLLLNGLYQRFFHIIQDDWVSKIGRTALSNYILQNVIMGLLFYGYGLALFNQFSRLELIALIPFIWAVQILFTLLWLKKYKQGPLEHIWRKLTYRTFTR